MIRCNNCGTDNLDGSEYCDECGMKLSAAVAPSLASAQQVAKPSPSAPPMPGMPQMPPMSPPSMPPVPPAPPQAGPGNASLLRPVTANSRTAPEPPSPPPFSASTAAPKSAGTVPPPPPPPPFAPPGRAAAPPRMGNDSVAAGMPPTAAPTAPAPANNAIASSYGKSPSARAKLIIQRGGTIGKEFMLTDTESNIGRWDADGGIFPDVDLDQDDPEAKVSRRHARIIHQNGQYLIEDLGSTNGTFINRGRRLLPGNRHPLNNGDEIIVGKTFLKFVVE
ncbi:MAG: FHA domain-containing protein [Acidobacteriota bacterium]